MGKVLNCKTPKILMDMRRGDEKRREGRKGQEREEKRTGVVSVVHVFLVWPW